tara:strand:- start:1318 stop:1914 length:597 start_codon:yes stop_codon:yes gene_type:complete
MADWVLQLIENHGYIAIFFLMFLENVFPPIPSEVILPLSGYIASQGSLNPLLILIASVSGAMLGVIFWYLIGRLIGQLRLEKFFEKYGVYIAITLNDYQKGLMFFEKYRRISVFFGRLIPVIRTVISIPAGLTKMRFLNFTILSTLGTIIWSGLLLYSGYFAGREYEIAAHYIGIITNVIIGLLILCYVIKIIHFQPK